MKYVICLGACLCMTLWNAIAQNSAKLDNTVGVDQAPQPLNVTEIKKEIGYPKAAVDNCEEGMVVARIKVSKGGKYLTHEIVKDAGTTLTAAVESKVAQLLFEPAKKGQEAVAYWVNIPFSFKLLPGNCGKSSQDGASSNAYALSGPQPKNLREVQQAIGYPQVARENCIQGEVFVKVWVDTQGNYARHEVTQNPDPVLTKAVEARIPTLRFEVPTAQQQWVEVPFRFRLIGGCASDEAEIAQVGANSPLRSLRIYPNPASTRVTFSMELSPNARQVEVEVTDQSGEVVRRKSFNNPDANWEATLTLGDLPTGIYFITVRTGKEAIVKRWVKS